MKTFVKEAEGHKEKPMAIGINDFKKFFKEEKILMMVLASYYLEKAKMCVIMQEKQRQSINFSATYLTSCFYEFSANLPTLFS